LLLHTLIRRKAVAAAVAVNAQVNEESGVGLRTF